jgi:hypothetical protein
MTDGITDASDFVDVCHGIFLTFSPFGVAGSIEKLPKVYLFLKEFAVIYLPS